MKKIKVAEFVDQGELDGTEKDSQEVLDACCGLLDSACSYDIVGDVLFKGKDGHYYKVVVEAIIERVSKKDAEARLAEKKAEDQWTP